MTSSRTHDHPECLLCHGKDIRPRSRHSRDGSGEWAICQCLTCKTSFVHPTPDPQTLAAYYDSAYYGPGQGKFVGPVEGIVSLFRYLRARTIRKLSRRATKTKGTVPAGRVLDVGCGRGLMLKFLKRWGYEVEGIELDSQAAARAGHNLNQKIQNSLEDTVMASARPYDVVCFWHSLEHLPESGRALALAHSLLAPGGLLVISAPHMGSIQSRLSAGRWLHLDLPRHLAHFNMKHLAVFLQDNGYCVVRENHFSQEYNVIDTLCYFYALLGFSHLYPFDLIRHMKRHGACRELNPMENVLGPVLLIPLTGVAFLVSNFFSLLGSGSTATLFLRKESRPVKDPT